MIAELLDPRCVILDLQGRKKRQVIEELAQRVAEVHDLGDAGALTAEIMEREQITSTGIGHGIGIPHRLTARVKRTVIAFGRKSEGLPFDSIDNKPVTLVFLILGPEGKHVTHLKLLSKLSRLLHNTVLLERLHTATTAEEVIEALAGNEEG